MQLLTTIIFLISSVYCLRAIYPVFEPISILYLVKGADYTLRYVTQTTYSREGYVLITWEFPSYVVLAKFTRSDYTFTEWRYISRNVRVIPNHPNGVVFIGENAPYTTCSYNNLLEPPLCRNISALTSEEMKGKLLLAEYDYSTSTSDYFFIVEHNLQNITVLKISHDTLQVVARSQKLAAYGVKSDHIDVSQFSDFICIRVDSHITEYYAINKRDLSFHSDVSICHNLNQFWEIDDNVDSAFSVYYNASILQCSVSNQDFSFVLQLDQYNITTDGDVNHLSVNTDSVVDRDSLSITPYIDTLNRQCGYLRPGYSAQIFLFRLEEKGKYYGYSMYCVWCYYYSNIVSFENEVFVTSYNAIGKLHQLVINKAVTKLEKVNGDYTAVFGYFNTLGSVALTRTDKYICQINHQILCSDPKDMKPVSTYSFPRGTQVFLNPIGAKTSVYMLIYDINTSKFFITKYT
jgi:hypothetical protein